MPTSALIVLTGATRGLGLAMARGFAAAGHTVLGCGRDGEALQGIGRELGPPHELAAVDVSDAAAVETWARDLLARHGAPDLLINNAALINRNAPLWEVPAEELSRVVDVNVKGVTHTIRAFVPAMIERGSGVVVNFSSGWGRSTAPEVAPYCATKWAIEGLTRSLAQELPPGMAAVAYNPGVIDTDMLRSTFGGAAGGYPDAATWAERAVPEILALGR